MPLIENSPSQINEAKEPPGFDTTSLKNNLTLPPASFYFFFVITAMLLNLTILFPIVLSYSHGHRFCI
jgi:hypothetical protein